MFDEISTILETRLGAVWTGAGTTPIAWSNVVYTPIQGTSFIRPVITETLSEKINVGEVGYYRDHGLMTIQVFTPRREGSRNNATFASKLVGHFRGYQSGGVFCVAGRVETVGETKEWYQSNVIIDYYFDKC